MKVTINFDDAILADAIQMHLDTGISVQNYIIASVRFFRDMYNREQAGSIIGFGDSTSFRKYNTEASPKNYLKGITYVDQNMINIGDLK